MQQQIIDLAGQTSNIKTPLGSKENPGRTCRDLHACHPQLKNGTIFSVAELQFRTDRAIQYE